MGISRRENQKIEGVPAPLEIIPTHRAFCVGRSSKMRSFKNNPTRGRAEALSDLFREIGAEFLPEEFSQGKTTYSRLDGYVYRLLLRGKLLAVTTSSSLFWENDMRKEVLEWLCRSAIPDSSIWRSQFELSAATVKNAVLLLQKEFPESKTLRYPEVAAFLQSC